MLQRKAREGTGKIEESPAILGVCAKMLLWLCMSRVRSGVEISQVTDI